MVEEFVKTHLAVEATRFIFKRIGEYLSSCPTAWLFDAVNEKEDLVGFDVAEFKPRTYAHYMFNFSSETDYIPGASDLLLSEIIEQAKAEGKKCINLGLGINTGVTFFKKKWSGESYLPYHFGLY
ncbi:MAG: hypothetical protein MUP41_12355, partial [Desulfobacterales bacterium]|nr:hypothetical protein [Desulfobacterales bacterium]